MRIEKIRRWQWVLISLVIGGLLGVVRQMYTDEIQGKYPNSLNTQPQFEQALFAEYLGARHFKDLVVYPMYLGEGSRQRVEYIVAGKWYPGRPERTSDGKVRAVWRPSFYRHPVQVFQPVTDLSKLPKPVSPELIKSFKEIKNPTILDYLKTLQANGNLTFRYAWYYEPKTAMGMWVGFSVLGIGFIFPTIVYLIAFGKLNPPREKKTIDLSKVKQRTIQPSSAHAAPKVTEKDLSEVERMGNELEAKLAASASEHSTSAGPAAPQESGPIRQLTATKLELSDAQQQEKDERHFGAAADDFYPTERKAAPHKPP